MGMVAITFGVINVFNTMQASVSGKRHNDLLMSFSNPGTIYC